MSLEKYMMKNGRPATEALGRKTPDVASLGVKSEAKARKIRQPEGLGDTENMRSDADEVKLDSPYDGDLKSGMDPKLKKKKPYLD